MTALPGQTNEGLEMTPDTQRKIFPRSDTTLTQVVMMIIMMIMIMILMMMMMMMMMMMIMMMSQVDLDILSAQANVKSEVNSSPGDPGDPVTQSMANFLSRPLTAGRSENSWNPFRKQSGILKVLHAQAKRNRMVSKHGKINTYVRSDKMDVSR